MEVRIMPEYTGLLELMQHHNYFKRPDSSVLNRSKTMVRLGDRTFDEEECYKRIPALPDSPPPFVLAYLNQDSIFQTPKAQNHMSDDSQSPPPMKRRCQNPCLNPGWKVKRMGHIKPMKLAKVFSFSEVSAVSNYTQPVSLHSEPAEAIRERNSRWATNRSYETDFHQECENEDELRRTVSRGTSYHVFDEREVLEAIAEVQGRHIDSLSQLFDSSSSASSCSESEGCASAEEEDPSVEHEVVFCEQVF